MKNMSYLLSHIKNVPYLKKFRKNTYLDMLKKALPKNFQQFLCFMYIKNEILFMVFEHPSMKMELLHKRDFIQSIIKQIEKIHNLSLGIKKIEPIISMKRFENKTKQKATAIDYTFTEQSSGSFANSLEDEKLHNQIEHIKTLILKNKKWNIAS